MLTTVTTDLEQCAVILYWKVCNISTEPMRSKASRSNLGERGVIWAQRSSGSHCKAIFAHTTNVVVRIDDQSAQHCLELQASWCIPLAGATAVYVDVPARGR